MGVYSVNPPQHHVGQGTLLHDFRGQVATMTESVRGGWKKLGYCGPPGYSISRNPMAPVNPPADSSPSIYRFESPSRVGSPAHCAMAAGHASPSAGGASKEKQQDPLPQLVQIHGAYSQLHLPHDSPSKPRQASRESSNPRTQPSFLPLPSPLKNLVVEDMTDSNRPRSSPRRPDDETVAYNKPLKAQVYADGHHVNGLSGTYRTGSPSNPNHVRDCAPRPCPHSNQTSAYSHDNRSSSLNPATSGKPSHLSLEPSKIGTELMPEPEQASASNLATPKPLKLSNRLSRPFDTGPLKFSDSLPGRSEHPLALQPGMKVAPQVNLFSHDHFSTQVRDEHNPQVSAATEYVPYKVPKGRSTSETVQLAGFAGTSQVRQISTQLDSVCGLASVAARNRRAIVRKPVANTIPVVELEVRESGCAPVKLASSAQASAYVPNHSAIPSALRPGRSQPQSRPMLDASIHTAEMTGNSHPLKMPHQELHLLDQVKVSESVESRAAPVTMGLLAVATLPGGGERSSRKSEKERGSENGSVPQSSAINLALYGPAAIAPATVFSLAVVPRNLSAITQAKSAINRGTPVNSSMAGQEQMKAIPDVLRIGKRVENGVSSGKTHATIVRQLSVHQSPSRHESDEVFLHGNVDMDGGVFQGEPGPTCKPSRIESFRFTKDWGTKLNGLVQGLKQGYNGVSPPRPIPSIIVTYHELPSDDSGMVVKVLESDAGPAELEATLSNKSQANSTTAVEIRSLVRPLAPGQTSRSATVSTMAPNTLSGAGHLANGDAGYKRPNFHWLRFGRRDAVEDPANEHCRQYRVRRDATRRAKREGTVLDSQS